MERTIDTTAERTTWEAMNRPKPPSEMEALRAGIRDLRDAMTALRADIARLTEAMTAPKEPA
jgi:hypothetical protein